MHDLGHEERKGSGRSVWDLVVFRRAYDIALEAHRLAMTFPKHEQFELASQLRRSSKSICANLAEGRGRQRGSSVEFRRYILIAIGSADESALWSKFALDLGYITTEQYRHLEKEFSEIARMLNAMASKLP